MDTKGQDRSACQQKWAAWHQQMDALHERLKILHEKMEAEHREHQALQHAASALGRRDVRRADEFPLPLAGGG